VSVASDLFQGGGEVRDEIVGIFQTDVKPDKVRRRRLGYGASRIDGKSETFVAAPAEADPEQVQPFDERGAICGVRSLELEREEPRRALEVALP